MVQQVKKWWKDQRGVTLIELLAVVIILGIIAAIAAPSVISNFGDAKANSDKQTAAVIEDAAKRWVMDIAKDHKVEDIELSETDDFDDATITISTDTTYTNFEDYISNLDENGKITSAVDTNQTFHLTITDGKVNVEVKTPAVAK